MHALLSVFRVRGGLAHRLGNAVSCARAVRRFTGTEVLAEGVGNARTRRTERRARDHATHGTGRKKAASLVWTRGGQGQGKPLRSVEAVVKEHGLSSTCCVGGYRGLLLSASCAYPSTRPLTLTRAL